MVDIPEDFIGAGFPPLQAELLTEVFATRSIQVSTRTEMKALASVIGQAFLLTEAGRQGIWVVTGGDYVSRIAADPLEGLFLACDDVSASIAGLVRVVQDDYVVTWWGATPGGSVNSYAGVQGACTTLTSIYAGGPLLLPGVFRSLSKIVVAGCITFKGYGQAVTGLTSGGTDIDLLQFSAGSNGAGFRDMLIFANTTSGATKSVVSVDQAVVGLIAKDSTISGGLIALKSQGTDCIFDNVYPSATSSSGINLYSTGANWYKRCKFDQNASIADAVVLTALAGTSADQENAFEMCDFSGTFTDASLAIDDSLAVGRVLSSSFGQCTFSGAIRINNARITKFDDSCRFGSGTFVTNSLMGVNGCEGLSAITVTGTGVRYGSGNYNISLGASIAFYFHKNGVAQTGMSNGAYQQVTWSTARINTGGGTLSSNQYTVPAGFSGKATMSAALWWTANADATPATGYTAKLRKNGADVVSGVGEPISGVSGQAVAKFSVEDVCVAGDVYEILAFGDSATGTDDLQIDGNQYHVFWSGILIPG